LKWIRTSDERATNKRQTSDKQATNAPFREPYTRHGAILINIQVNAYFALKPLLLRGLMNWRI